MIGGNWASGKMPVGGSEDSSSFAALTSLGMTREPHRMIR